ncbi:MAG: Clp protease N-terminal domain-containing protein, partial [Gammaproteobacteria bacterium]
MLSKDLESNLNSAFRQARSRRHEYMTVEHLLLALLENEAATRVLKACAADIPQLSKELAEFV